MADLTITATSVAPVTGYQFVDAISGATLTAGLACYIDSVTETAKIADNDDTAAKATVRGIALNAASSGQPVRLFTGGDINLGATLTVGIIYCLSSTAGAICPSSDLGSSDYVSILGVATTASNLKANIFNSGAQKP